MPVIMLAAVTHEVESPSLVPVIIMLAVVTNEVESPSLVPVIIMLAAVTHEVESPRLQSCVNAYSLRMHTPILVFSYDQKIRICILSYML